MTRAELVELVLGESSSSCPGPPFVSVVVPFDVLPSAARAALGACTRVGLLARCVGCSARFDGGGLDHGLIESWASLEGAARRLEEELGFEVAFAVDPAPAPVESSDASAVVAVDFAARCRLTGPVG